MPGEVIAFITEGDWSEPQLIKSINENFHFGTAEIMSFKTNIHTLFKVLQEDDFDTDIIGVLSERHQDIRERVAAIGRDNISQIFLFFDYDGHDPLCDNRNMIAMLEKFDNETENGKLYISYPMFEAVKDFAKENDECGRRCCSEISVGKHYKQDVSVMTAYQDVSKLNAGGWNRIINFSIKKSVCIVKDRYDVIDYADFLQQIGQLDIFRKQLEKYIIPFDSVAVLSAFPLFLIDFFGKSFYNLRLIAENEVERRNCTHANTLVRQ